MFVKIALPILIKQVDQEVTTEEAMNQIIMQILTKEEAI